MAIAITEVAELATSNNQGDYDLGTFTPSADSILVALVIGAGSDQSTIGTLSDSEGAWTRKRTDFFDATKVFHVFWRKVDSSPVEITPNFNNGADTLTGCGAVIYQVIPDTMPSGDPIRQTVFTPPASGTNPSVTFGSALLTGNGYLACIFNGTVQPAAIDAAPSGWTGTADNGFTAPLVGFWAGFRAGGETGTTITATNAESQFVGMWGVEVWNEEPPASTEEQSQHRGFGRGLHRGMT